MQVSRYIITHAVKMDNNELVPIWDSRISYNKSDNCGESLMLREITRKEFFSLVECIYDLKTKKIKLGIEINVYPEGENLEFQKEEIVLFEKKNRVLTETKIIDIVFEEYDLQIKKGRDLESYDIQRLSKFGLDENKIEPKSLYAIKHWKPYYVVEDGTKVKYTHKLFRKDNQDN